MRFSGSQEYRLSRLQFDVVENKGTEHSNVTRKLRVEAEDEGLELSFSCSQVPGYKKTQLCLDGILFSRHQRSEKIFEGRFFSWAGGCCRFGDGEEGIKNGLRYQSGKLGSCGNVVGNVGQGKKAT